MKFDSADLAICVTCGTQYDVPLSEAPKSCRICDDPRQYVPATGQTWSSLAAEAGKQHNTFTQDTFDTRIWFLETKPLQASVLPSGLADSSTHRKQLGIGERAILLQTPAGNVLWDLIAFLDDATVDFIKQKGGLKAIVVSHPHFWTTHLEWARVFDCPVYLCKADEEWLNREDPYGLRRLVQGTTDIVPGVTAIQAGGHFDGSSFLHWENKLFIADTMMIVPSGFYHKDRLPGTTSFSFMWSYPNMIPLPPSKVHGIWKSLKPFEFDTTYGGFMGQNVQRPDLKAQALESAKVFLRKGGHEQADIFDETL